MWESIALIISLIVGVFCFVLTWKLYHHFWSLADVVHESNFSYFVKRFSVSCVFGFIGLAIAVSYFEPNSKNTDVSNKIALASESNSKSSSNGIQNTSTQNQNITENIPNIDLTKSLKENFSPSFDCSKTNLEADIAVCNNYYLSTIDVKNAELYKIAYAKNSQIALAIRSATYKKKIECGSDIKCIGEVYLLSLGRYSEIIDN
jgi:hypothetical protein